MRCYACGIGEFVATDIRGTTRRYRAHAAVPVTRSVLVRQCSHCGEELLSAEEAAALDAVLELEYERLRAAEDDADFRAAQRASWEQIGDAVRAGLPHVAHMARSGPMPNAFNDTSPVERLRRLSDSLEALQARVGQARRRQQSPLRGFWALQDVELLLQLADRHEPAISSHLEEIALKILDQREAQEAGDAAVRAAVQQGIEQANAAETVIGDEALHRVRERRTKPEA